jgi:hypothetical protein
MKHDFTLLLRFVYKVKMAYCVEAVCDLEPAPQLLKLLDKLFYKIHMER